VTTQIEVLAAIGKMIRNHNTAGLYISHDLAVVAQVAHRIMVLRGGRMVEEGETGQILENPREDYTRELVSVRAHSAHAQPKDAVTTKQVLLELTDVTAAFGAMKAVNGASFQVCKGETVAIVGESGSGKSTLARVICGLHPPVGGTVKFKGEILPPKFRLRSHTVLRQIQLIYQQPDIALNPRQRVKDIIGRPLSLYFGLGGEQLHSRLLELMRLTELPDDALMRWPGELSGGQKQRVCIARALAAEPDLLICDEITSALDPLVAEEILRLLERLQENTGLAYLYITHDFGTVRRLANRVVVMLRGDIVAEGGTTEVFSLPCHPYVQTLLSSVPEMRADWLNDTLGIGNGTTPGH
jgi:peptide/nickel transport system ATP-binding protein